MAASAQDQVDQLKSLINDLEERRQNLRLFDGTDEINFHCDDLIGQVTLTVESAMDHLNKVQDRMINEINEYRQQLIDAQDSSKNDQAQSPAEKGLRNLSTKIEMIKSNKLPHDEALELAKNLLENANDLRKKLRAETFGGNFLRLIETNFMDDDIIGKLDKSNKDVQDDLEINHLKLDKMVSSAQVFDFLSVKKSPSIAKSVTAILFLRNGHLAVGLDCDSILIWDPKANKQVHRLMTAHKAGDIVTALAELSSGSLVVGFAQGSIEIWDIKAEKIVFDIGDTEEPIRWLKALPGGKLIAFGRDIRVWDLSSLNEKSKPPFTRFKAQLELGWFDRFLEIHTWNTMNPETELHLSKEISLYTRSFDDFHPKLRLSLRVHMELLWDGHLAYSYLLPPGPKITVWDPNTSEIVKEVNFTAKDAESCTILPNGDFVLCRADNRVEIYSINDQKMHASFKNDKGPIVAIRMQTKHLLTFIHLEDLKLPILALGGRLDYRLTQNLVTSTCFSDDGKHLAIGSQYERVVMWPVQD